MDINFNYIKTLSVEDYDNYLNSSILIIGKASSDSLAGEIIKVDDIEKVFEVYGNSDLSSSLQTALSSDITEVYAYNAFYDEDYIKVVNRFPHYEFTYIVPIGINLSDTFYDPYTNKQTYYVDIYSSNLLESTSSTIIFTDKHAELYEDLDSYLYEMESIVSDIKKRLSNTKNLNHVVFCLNLLAGINYSNVLLATKLIQAGPGKYPDNITELEPVFDYDYFDIHLSDYVYFKANQLSRSSSIENLLTLREEYDVYKSLLVTSVLKYITKNLTLEQYKGRLYTTYIKIQILNDVKVFMNNLLGDMINDYEVVSLDFITDTPGAGSVVITMTITPRGTFEKITIVLEV